MFAGVTRKSVVIDFRPRIRVRFQASNLVLVVIVAGSNQNVVFSFSRKMVSRENEGPVSVHGKVVSINRAGVFQVSHITEKEMTFDFISVMDLVKVINNKVCKSVDWKIIFIAHLRSTCWLSYLKKVEYS